jgi:hypothetical protein
MGTSPDYPWHPFTIACRSVVTVSATLARVALAALILAACITPGTDGSQSDCPFKIVVPEGLCIAGEYYDEVACLGSDNTDLCCAPCPPNYYCPDGGAAVTCVGADTGPDPDPAAANATGLTAVKYCPRLG